MKKKKQTAIGKELSELTALMSEAARIEKQKFIHSHLKDRSTNPTDNLNKK